MSLALASAEPYKNVQFGRPKLATPFSPVSQFTSSYCCAQFSTEPLSFAEFITVCNTAIDNSLYHYCTQCHQFCGSTGFVCNKAAILQLHWRKSVLWFIYNSVCSYWKCALFDKEFQTTFQYWVYTIEIKQVLIFLTSKQHNCIDVIYLVFN